MERHRPVKIVGLGNPILDISAVVDANFLKKHNIESNGTKHIDNDGIFMELESSGCDVKYMAGGSTDNACRVAQNILEEKETVGYFGCIGKDQNGMLLERAMHSAGVATFYQESGTFPTGRCAVLITDRINRSLVTNPAAANKFTPDHLYYANNWRIIQQAKLFYTGGFFLASSNDSLLKVAQFVSKQEDKLLCFNLSSPFLCRPPHVKRLINIIQYVDIIIGNSAEAETLAECGLNMVIKDIKDHKKVAKAIFIMPKVGEHRKNRVVIITRGNHSCIAIDGDGDGRAKEFPVIPVNESDIVDTNGAGDAFVGGLLAHCITHHKSETNFAKAITSGLKTAYQSLKVSGCRFDPIQDV